MTGLVYLLHFVVDEAAARPLGAARHYVGFSTRVAARLEEHRAGRGARLTRVLARAGGTFVLARTWPGDQALERTLKRRGPKSLCPLCTPPRDSHRP